jgi:hypothetical protein
VAAGTCTGAAAPYISLPVNSTITIGAGKLRVEQAWTNSDPVPTKLRLSYCAPGAVSCISTGAEYLPAKIVEDASNKRVYEIETRPDQWDSPYVTKTAWTFRWNFDNQDGMGTGRMTGSISWKFELFKLE